MESASQSDNPPQEPPTRLSSLLGVVVAVLTLTLPIVAIAHYSSARMDALEAPPATLSQPQRP